MLGYYSALLSAFRFIVLTADEHRLYLQPLFNCPIQKERAILMRLKKTQGSTNFCKSERGLLWFINIIKFFLYLKSISLLLKPQLLESWRAIPNLRSHPQYSKIPYGHHLCHLQRTSTNQLNGQLSQYQRLLWRQFPYQQQYRLDPFDQLSQPWSPRRLVSRFDSHLDQHESCHRILQWWQVLLLVGIFFIRWIVRIIYSEDKAFHEK